jgi:tetratricopeptide (TPR) repeat protein
VVVVAVLWIESQALGAAMVLNTARVRVKINPSRALDDVKLAAKMAPWNPRFQTSLGEVALHAGEPEEAIAAYRHAIEDDPYRASYWWQLARVKIATHGVDAEALQLLKKAVELNPTNPRYGQALAAAKESVRQSPGSLLQSDPAKEAGSSN